MLRVAHHECQGAILSRRLNSRAEQKGLSASKALRHRPEKQHPFRVRIRSDPARGISKKVRGGGEVSGGTRHSVKDQSGAVRMAPQEHVYDGARHSPWKWGGVREFRQ